MKQKISESEWRVLDALWEKSGRTVHELCGALSDTGWSRNTIHTFLTRLEGKGYVSDDGGSPKRYSAAVPRDDCVREQTRSFVSRVFDGSASRMLAAFLKDCELDADEVEDLRHLLDEAVQRQK